MTRVTFIWGPGGVGKSHVSVRRAFESTNAQQTTLLMTLDPSLRVLDLLGLPHASPEKDSNAVEVTLAKQTFHVRRVDVWKVFEQLEKRKPASPRVRVFFEQMVRGMQEFRDYLSLLQLADEVSRGRYQHIIVDTPPFQDAEGLHRSMTNLRDFFEKALVQLAMKSTSMPWVQTTVKKIFDFTRVFVGKTASAQVFEFIEWLSEHHERFKSAAQTLEKLVFSENSNHDFVVTPESSRIFLESTAHIFADKISPTFFVNRSAHGLVLPEGESSFHREIRMLQERELKLLKEIDHFYPKYHLERIPILFMGDDTIEEMELFVQASMATYQELPEPSSSLTGNKTPR